MTFFFEATFRRFARRSSSRSRLDAPPFNPDVCPEWLGALVPEKQVARLEREGVLTPESLAFFSTAMRPHCLLRPQRRWQRDLRPQAFALHANVRHVSLSCVQFDSCALLEQILSGKHCRHCSPPLNRRRRRRPTLKTSSFLRYLFHLLSKITAGKHGGHVWMLTKDRHRLVPVSDLRGFHRLVKSAVPPEVLVALSALPALPVFQDELFLEGARSAVRCIACGDDATPAQASKPLFKLLYAASLREGSMAIDALPLFNAVRLTGESPSALPAFPLSTWGKKQAPPLYVLLEILARASICEKRHCRDVEDAHLWRPLSVFETGEAEGREVRVTRGACGRCGASHLVRYEAMSPSRLSHKCVLEVPVVAEGDVVAQDAIDAWADRAVSCGCGDKKKLVERRELVSAPPNLAVQFVLPDGDPAPSGAVLPFCIRTARSLTVPVVGEGPGNSVKLRIVVVGKRARWTKGRLGRVRAYSLGRSEEPTGGPDSSAFVVDVLDRRTRWFVRVGGGSARTVTDEEALASTGIVQIDFLIGSPAEAEPPASDDRVVPVPLQVTTKSGRGGGGKGEGTRERERER